MNIALAKWPFIDNSSDYLIERDKYYGFMDSGFVTGEYDTAKAAIDGIAENYPDYCTSTNPAMLGDVAIVVMTGLDFIKQLLVLSDNDFEALSDYGDWSK